jgi:diguanylate cyclase (GGDEF)-like protein/PAS domain S-box-containing protein
VSALFVVFAFLIVAVHLASPIGADGRVSFLIATCGAALLACLAVLVRGADPLRVWLAIGIAASAVGDVAWEAYVLARGEGPDISFADVGWLASYLCVGAALVVLVRRSRVRWRDSPEVMMDAATVVVISATAVWVFWVSPTMFDASEPLGVRLVWSAYPVLDAVLLGVLARVLLTRSGHDRSLVLVASGIAMWLLADMGFLVWGEDSAAGPLLDVGWMLGSLLLAAGTWALSSRSADDATVGAQPHPRPAGRARLALTIAPIFIPWLIEMWAHANGWSIALGPLVVSTVLLCVLVYARASYLLRQRHEAEVLLRSNERLSRALAAHSSDAALLVGIDGRLMRDAPGLASLVGTDVGSAAGTNLLAMVDLAPSVGAQLVARFQEAVSRPGEVVRVEFPIVNAAAEQLWLSARVISLLEDPDVAGVVINLHDITQRKRAEEAIARAAWVDDLTGLPNRQALSRHLGDELAATNSEPHDLLGLAFIDVQRFRIINDSLGHGAGDEILRLLAERIGGAVGDDDLVARFGGDVFAVVARRAGRTQFADLAAALATSVGRPLRIRERELTPMITVGVALASAGCHAESVLAVADDALHRAKHRGAGRVAIVDVAENGSRNSLDHELELRAAISDGQLELEYQAVIDVSGRVIDGFEALVRWNHPSRGRVGPGEFIPLAEETGLIVPLGEWVLETALTVASQWDPRLSIAVNLSPVQVAEADMADMIEDLLARHRFDPRRLILEVTESTLVSDDRELIEPLERLRALGVRISVDDFGTGYSSFSYLRRLPVDILKIDKSFIDDLPGDGEPIVAAIVGLASALGLEVIAEGVEDDDQLDALDRLGCSHVQGFLLHRPAPATDLCVELATPACSESCPRIGTDHCTERALQPRRRPHPDRPVARSDRRPLRVRHSGTRRSSSHDHHDTPAVTTKATLATVSHAVEEIAAAAGPDAVVLSLFQRGPYFAPMAARYERLADAGATVVVAFAGDGPAADGVHHGMLSDDDPLAGEWCVILLTSGIAAHVRGEDLIDLDPTAADLESGRRFAATWGFERHTAADPAEDVIEQLEPILDPTIVHRVRTAITVARSAPESMAERSLGASATVLAARLDRTQRELSATAARLADETAIATRDPLTGLPNREGLERWLGGVDTLGLAMPPLGVILIDLDGFKQINDTLGHLAGDELLRDIAAALLTSTRPGDLVARWGGDEFIVLCPHAADDDLHAIARRLLDAVAGVDIDGAHVTASAGIQICTQRPLPLDQVDRALYSAKLAGGGRPVLAPSAQ